MYQEISGLIPSVSPLGVLQCLLSCGREQQDLPLGSTFELWLLFEKGTVLLQSFVRVTGFSSIWAGLFLAGERLGGPRDVPDQYSTGLK